jgi:enoyl-CoA hydratase/carnithine racemase
MTPVQKSDLVQMSVEDGIARVALNRPDALNALTPALLEALGDAIQAVGANPAARVCVLHGLGRAFSAGVDLKAIQDSPLEGGNVGEQLNAPARRALAEMRALPQALIAQVHGACFTGALELALGCDFIIAADDAKFGDTHAKLGFRPTWGMTQRLPRAVGAARAKYIAFTARTFSGREAADWGLALAAPPAIELAALVDALARDIAANSPGSIAAYKDLFAAAQRYGLDDGLAYEAHAAYEIADVNERVAALVAQISRR